MAMTHIENVRRGREHFEIYRVSVLLLRSFGEQRSYHATESLPHPTQ